MQGSDYEMREAKLTASSGDGLVPTPVFDPDNEDRKATVAFWMSRLKRRKAMEDFQEWEAIRKSAREFYKGNLLEEDKVQAWQGPTAENNSWRRIASYFVDAIYANNPNLAVRPAEGRSNADTAAGAASVEAMLKYIYRDTKMAKEFKRALKAAWLDNLAFAKIAFDPVRQLVSAKWCPGLFLVDPSAHGDLTRANWVAEEYRLSKITVLGDEMFPIEKRQQLAGLWEGRLVNSQSGGEEEVTLYYVYSREGVNPQESVQQVAAGQSPERPAKVCFVVCEGYDDFLYEAEDPTPWLDADEYPYPVLMLDETPGEWFGSPPWKMMQPLCNAINWLLSFHIATMKKRATDVHLFNKNIVKDHKKIVDSACSEAHAVDGDPNQAHARLDLGAADTSALQGAELLQGWLDRLSGYNEVARGESSGRKTAEEARYLQQNTSLVTKGPAQAFDSFMEECFRQIGLATVLYIPAFSWRVGPGGEVMTRAVQMTPPTPQVDPMTGQPQIDPMTGQPAMMPPQPQIVEVPVQPEEAAQVGAQDMGPFGMRMPDTQQTDAMPQIDPVSGEPVMGVPQFSSPSAGKILKRGADYYIGDEWAMKWPQGSFEDTKRDLQFIFEAGSTRADFRYDQQQAAAWAIQMLGPWLERSQSWGELYELLQVVNNALPLDRPDRRLPPRDQFVGMMQQAAMQAQMAAQGPQGPQEGDEVEIQNDAN